MCASDVMKFAICYGWNVLEFVEYPSTWSVGVISFQRHACYRHILVEIFRGICACKWSNVLNWSAVFYVCTVSSMNVRYVCDVTPLCIVCLQLIKPLMAETFCNTRWLFPAKFELKNSPSLPYYGIKPTLFPCSNEPLWHHVIPMFQ